MFDFVRKWVRDNPSGFAQKWLAYHVKEYLDPLAIRHFKEVCDVADQHIAELEDFWRLTSPEECANLVVVFLDELRCEWPREYPTLDPERVPDAISEGLRTSIKQAYATGCMMGEGWISEEQLSDFGLYLGDKLARDIRLVLKGAKVRGLAFAMGFAVVAAHGHSKVLQSRLGGKGASQRRA